MSVWYVCEACGRRFESEWSDEEARAEAGSIFGEVDGSLTEMAVVCDDCYKNLVPVAGP